MSNKFKTLISGLVSQPNDRSKQPCTKETIQQMEQFFCKMKDSEEKFSGWMAAVLEKARTIQLDGSWSYTNDIRFRGSYSQRERKLRKLALELTKNYDKELIATFQNCAEKIRRSVNSTSIRNLNHDDDASKYNKIDYGVTISSDGNADSDHVSPDIFSILSAKVAAFNCLGRRVQDFITAFEKAMSVFEKLEKAKSAGFDTSEFFRHSLYPEHGNSWLMLSVYMHAKKDRQDIKPFKPVTGCKNIKASTVHTEQTKPPVASKPTSEQGFYPSVDKSCKYKVFGNSDPLPQQ